MTATDWREELKKTVRETIRQIEYHGGGVNGGDWAADIILDQTINAVLAKVAEGVPGQLPTTEVSENHAHNGCRQAILDHLASLTPNSEVK